MSKTENYGWTDVEPESSGYINRGILEIIKATSPQPGTVLDAGCGNGVLAKVLTDSGYDVTGVDGDRGAIDIARRKYPSIRFETCLFESPPPGKFDFVCSTEVVEHLYAPHELARYCYEALSPGGYLAISTPYHGYLKNLALSLTDGWDKHHTADWHGGHIKFWSLQTLSRLLKDAGFEVTGFKGVGRLPYLWKSMILIARRPSV